MKLEFERSGGHLPVVLRASVDADQLSQSESDELKELVARADLPSTAATSRIHPDEMTYKIALTSGDNVQRELKFAETQVPSTVRPLLKWLAKRATAESIG